MFRRSGCAWNVGAMSIGGMGLYSYMLAHGTAGRVTASFYLVPGSVAILGWLMLGEQLSPLVVLGFLVASVGVWLVRRIPASRPSGLSC